MTEEAFWLNQSTSIADPMVRVAFLGGSPSILLNPRVTLRVGTREAAYSLLAAATQIAAWFDSQEAKRDANDHDRPQAPALTERTAL